MQPYSMGQDVFTTQADERFNSFSDPMNAVNMNKGNWGIDSNYMTPSFTSPYRPRYQGPQGNPNAAYQPTWGQGMNHTFNPFEGGGTNYGGNTYQQQSPYVDSSINNPMDGGANFAQKWVVPGVASWAAYKWLSKPMGNAAGNFAAGAMRGMAGNSFSASRTATLMAGARSVGGVLGSLAGPMIPATLAVQAFDKGIMDPYVAQRQMTNNFRQNFAGVTFGDGSGNLVNGGGFSRFAASKQASGISAMASKDMTFTQGEFSQLTDLSSRAGLMDFSNGSNMATKMKSISQQVKLVMAVANTSDFKEAIEMISKLQMAGVSSSSMTGVMAKIGGMASASGVSTQKFMNTTGAQAQYLFQSNGLNPYAGMLTAGSAMGAFTSAQRSGLMSPALLARMGGIEGATQSAATGMLGMAQSPYAGMMAFNAFNGGMSNSVVGNVSRFGGAMSGGIRSLGQFNMNSPASVSAMIEKNGIGSITGMLSHLGQVTPGAMTGKGVDAHAAYEMLTKTFGIRDDEARGLLEQIRASQNSGAVATQIAGIKRNSRDMDLKWQDQTGTNMGVLTAPMLATKRAFNEAQGVGVTAVSAILNPVSKATDKLEKNVTDWRYGKGDAAVGWENKSYIQITGKGGGRSSTSKKLVSDVTEQLNGLLKAGDKDAIMAVSGKTVQERMMGYEKLAAKKAISSFNVDMDGASLSVIEGAVSEASKRDVKSGGEAVYKVSNALKTLTGESSIQEAILKKAAAEAYLQDLENSEDGTGTLAGREAFNRDTHSFFTSGDEFKSNALKWAVGDDVDSKIAASKTGLLTSEKAIEIAKSGKNISNKDMMKKLREGGISVPLTEGISKEAAEASQEDLRSRSKAKVAELTQVEGLQKLLREQKIDFSTYNSSISKIAADKMMTAVDKFDSAVDRMNGGDSGPGFISSTTSSTAEFIKNNSGVADLIRMGVSSLAPEKKK